MKVSCLCVTRGMFISNAVEQFEKQTYPQRELVVVYQDPLSAMDIARLKRVDARLVKAKSSLNLGQLRNLALEAARGEFVLQWDDDDLFHPTRVQTMLGGLREANADAAVLQRWYMDDVQSRVMYLSSARTWEGSALVRTSAARSIGFQSLSRGEDSQFFADFDAAGGTWAKLDLPTLYVYRIHGGNTWDRKHFDALVSHAELVSSNRREAVLWSAL